MSGDGHERRETGGERGESDPFTSKSDAFNENADCEDGHAGRRSIASRRTALLMVINEDAGLIAWADPALDVTPDVLKLLAP